MSTYIPENYKSLLTIYDTQKAISLLKRLFEENLGAKKPVIKTGAEIPFTRYFYKYQQPIASEELKARFSNLELSVSKQITKLFE